jgi:hypothetical protein
MTSVVAVGRRLVAASTETVAYEPGDRTPWDAAAARVDRARARGPTAAVA